MPRYVAYLLTLADKFKEAKKKFEAAAQEIISLTEQFAQLEAKEKIVPKF